MSFDEARDARSARSSGYLGYDFVAKLEPTVPLPEPGPELPESRFVVVDTLVRFDHPSGIAEVLDGDPGEIGRRLEGPLPPELRAESGVSGPLVRYPDQAEHERRVRRAKEYIRAGDAFQIVLAQRADRPTSASAPQLYRALRRVNPSPYLFLLELGDLASSAPHPRRSSSARGAARA